MTQEDEISFDEKGFFKTLSETLPEVIKLTVRGYFESGEPLTKLNALQAATLEEFGDMTVAEFMRYAVTDTTNPEYEAVDVFINISRQPLNHFDLIHSMYRVAYQYHLAIMSTG